MFDDVKHVQGMIGRMRPDGCLRLDPLEDDWVQFGLWRAHYDAPAERLELRQTDAARIMGLLAEMVCAGALKVALPGREWRRPAQTVN